MAEAPKGIRARLDDRWRRYVFTLLAEAQANPDKKLSDAKISELCANDEARRKEWGEYPKTRTVTAIRKEWHGSTELERKRHRLLRWPESFEEGAVPWEAAPAGIELLREYIRTTRIRPTVSLTLWYWRLSAVRPQTSVKQRVHWARLLDLWAYLRRERADVEPPRDIELKLLFQGEELEEAKAKGLPREPYRIEHGDDGSTAIYFGPRNREESDGEEKDTR